MTWVSTFHSPSHPACRLRRGDQKVKLPITRLLLVTRRAAEADPKAEDSTFGCIASCNSLSRNAYYSRRHHSCSFSPVHQGQSIPSIKSDPTLEFVKICNTKSACHKVGTTRDTLHSIEGLRSLFFDRRGISLLVGHSAHADEKGSFCTRCMRKRCHPE